MKRPVEWYNEIKDVRIKELAILNLNKLKSLHETYDSMVAAIGTGFPWAHTPQGYDFWNKIHDDAPNIKSFNDYMYLLIN